MYTSDKELYQTLKRLADSVEDFFFGPAMPGNNELLEDYGELGLKNGLNLKAKLEEAKYILASRDTTLNLWEDHHIEYVNGKWVAYDEAGLTLGEYCSEGAAKKAVKQRAEYLR